jgi:hypothetical protein
LKQEGKPTLFLRLNDYGSVETIRKDIEEDQEFERAKDAGTPFYIHLDSVDEGLLTVKDMGRLGKELKKLKFKRLFIPNNLKAIP